MYAPAQTGAPNTHSLYTRYGHVGIRSRNHGMFTFWRRALKRECKAKERAAWLREVQVSQQLERLSSIAEDQLESDNDYLNSSSYLSLGDAAYQRHERFLYRMPAGAIFWDSYPVEDKWVAHEVVHVDNDYDGKVYRYARNVAHVRVLREEATWDIRVYPGHDIDVQPIVLPYYEHSLEQVQTLALTVLRIAR